jgi:uncharacterized protein (DUF1015 family)
VSSEDFIIMVQVFPFQALRYNLEAINAPLEAVIAPPYDVIDSTDQQRLYDCHAANVVRLVLNKKQAEDTETSNTYTRAAHFFKQWQQENTLVPEAVPAVYAYTQTFQLGDDAITRKGLLALIRIEDYASKQVLPHEATLGGPKVDRLKLNKATTATLSPIFLVYDDASLWLENQAEVYGTTSEGQAEPQWVEAPYDDGHHVVHRMKPVTAPGLLKDIHQFFTTKQMLIADGHHRYETAIALSQDARKQWKEKYGEEPAPGSLPTDYVLAFLANMSDGGLRVFPTHRILKQWPVPKNQASGWTTEQFEAELLKRFEKVSATAPLTSDVLSYTGPSSQASEKGYPWRLKLTDTKAVSALPKGLQQLDLAILDTVIFQDIFGYSANELKETKSLRFERNDEEYHQQLAQGAVAGFEMQSPSLHLVCELANDGIRMPQKSTYFYPKILSGLLFYSHALFINGQHAWSGVNSTDWSPVSVTPLPDASLYAAGNSTPVSSGV